MIYHVVATANGRVIGKDNKLPWHYPADLKYFKQLTTGSTVIMGRKTFESIGRPLPNRMNFVISRTQSGKGEGFEYFNSVEDALKAVKTEHAFIIGGANIYEQTLDLVQGIYMTRIYKDFEGDAYYPELPPRFEEKISTPLQEEPRIEVLFYLASPAQKA